MSNPYDSLFETSSGLPLDGATVAIQSAEFGFRDFTQGRPVFVVTYVIEETGATQEQAYTFGNKGTPSGDGRRLIEPPGKLPSSSNMGRLIDSLVTAFKNAGVTSPGAELGDPYLADSWEGTRWVLKGDERETESPDGGERKKRTLFIFDEYLGRGTPTQAPTLASAAAAMAPAGQATAAVNGDTTLRGEIVEFAKTFSDHSDFVEAVFEKFPAADQDPDIRKAIVITKPGSIWAQAHGG